MSPKKDTDPLDPYKRVRKRVPPPSRQIPDRRRKAAERIARREEREERGEGGR